MTSILFVIKRIYRNQLKYNYLRKKKLVLNFLRYSLNFHKGMILIAYKSPKLRTANLVVR